MTIILVSMSLKSLGLGSSLLYFINYFLKTTHTNKWSFECPTGLSRHLFFMSDWLDQSGYRLPISATIIELFATVYNLSDRHGGRGGVVVLYPPISFSHRQFFIYIYIYLFLSPRSQFHGCCGNLHFRGYLPCCIFVELVVHEKTSFTIQWFPGTWTRAK